MESNGNEYPQLTLFAEDTLVSPSVTPATATAPTTHGTFGHDSSTPFAYFDPDSHCWRTCQGTLVSDLDKYSQTWPRSGTTHNGIAYQRQPSAPRTSVIAYSSSLHETMEWTPTATANQMAPSMISRNPGVRLWPTPTAHDSKNRGGPDTPSVQRRKAKGKQLGLSMVVRNKVNPMWPTPTASSWGNEGSRNLIQQHVEQGDITEAEKRQMISGNGGKLNPMWVEWLMGFPQGWTDLED